MASLTAPLGMCMRANHLVPLRCRASETRASSACHATTSSTNVFATKRRVVLDKGILRVPCRQTGGSKGTRLLRATKDDGNSTRDDFDPFNLFSSTGNGRLVTEETKALEQRLGRAAMLGFFFTTVGELLTSGKGPLEQLRDEETYLFTHINPVSVAQDALAVGGIYVESVMLVWVCLAACFLLAVQNGLGNPSTKYRSKKQKREDAASLVNRVDTTVEEFKRALKEQVREQSPYELFNGRLAMVGFALAVMGDSVTGGLGPLTQLSTETGIPVIDAELFGAFFLFGVFFNVVATGVKVSTKAWRNGKEGVVSR